MISDSRIERLFGTPDGAEIIADETLPVSKIFFYLKVLPFYKKRQVFSLFYDHVRYLDINRKIGEEAICVDYKFNEQKQRNTFNHGTIYGIKLAVGVIAAIAGVVLLVLKFS
ncbi:MAG: hypothetical protein FWD61_18965 [Phycisphaerales bacterium]|nr:hypothetical protein [Phycisphaerales bacterium]